MERILVTGGAGYIGSHCCKAIAEAGFQPVVFDNLSTGHSDFVRWGPLIYGDVRDLVALDTAIRETTPVAVMHFAAQSIVPFSVQSPEETFFTNVSGTLNVLQAMLNQNVKRIVFSSTCAVYGEPDRLPLTEDTSIRPISPYGASKAMAERMMHDFGSAHGFSSVQLRYFNAAGADHSAMIGEWHDPETHVIPILLDVVMGRRSVFQLHGTDYDTPDGTAVRDFIHVTDLAAAHVAALRYLLDGGATAALNVGTGTGASVAELVRTVERVTGARVPLQYGPRREGDPGRLVADPASAADALRWRAERSLETIVADAWRWHQRLPQYSRLVA